MLRLEKAVLAAAFGLLLLIALLQILLRNGFSTSLPGAEELLQTLVLWLAMLGALGATREGNHIRIDLLAQVLPGPWGQRLHRLSALATAGLCAFAGYHGALLCLLEQEEGRLAFWGLPVWVTLLIIPGAFAAMALRFFRLAWRPAP